MNLLLSRNSTNARTQRKSENPLFLLSTQHLAPSTVKTVTSCIGTITLLALVAGCSSPKPTQQPSQSIDTSSQTSRTHSSQNTTSKPEVQPQSKSTYKVGEAVSIKDKNFDVQFTVNGTREHQGKKVLKPNKGNKWILVDTTIVNKGQKPETISVVSFQLIDSANKPYEVALLAEALDDVKSPTGELNPGDERRGEVAFEVPEKAQGLKLVFNPNSSECKVPDSLPKAPESINCKPIVVSLPN